MKHRAYIDIETTGLSWYGSDLTVIGVAIEHGDRYCVIQLLENTLSKRNLLAALKNVDELYSYNGSRFDLPFIEAKLRTNLKEHFPHTDLMYDCWRCNLKGGLKAVERKLGIVRRLANINGYMAVRLWYEYVNNKNLRALRTLLEYNREDILNLRLLRQKLEVK